MEMVAGMILFACIALAVIYRVLKGSQDGGAGAGLEIGDADGGDGGGGGGD